MGSRDVAFRAWYTGAILMTSGRVPMQSSTELFMREVSSRRAGWGRGRGPPRRGAAPHATGPLGHHRAEDDDVGRQLDPAGGVDGLESLGVADARAGADDDVALGVDISADAGRPRDVDSLAADQVPLDLDALAQVEGLVGLDAAAHDVAGGDAHLAVDDEVAVDGEAARHREVPAGPQHRVVDPRLARLGGGPPRPPPPPRGPRGHPPRPHAPRAARR